MLSLVKKFNQEREVAEMKRAIEERPFIAEFITTILVSGRKLADKPTPSYLREWWKTHDTGWPLATCMTIADKVERTVSSLERGIYDEDYIKAYGDFICKFGFFRLDAPSPKEKDVSDEAYIEAFEQAMRNFYHEMPGSWSVTAHKLIPIIWTQYLLHHGTTMEEWLDNQHSMKTESAGGRPSTLTIWTLNEDRAFLVTNTLAPPVEVIERPNGKYEIRSSLIESRYSRKKPTEKELQALRLPLKRIPSDRYLLFDPDSGLYQTDEELTEELNSVEDTFARMQRLILAFEPNAKDLKLYCTSRVAKEILKVFYIWARMMSPNPTGKEKCI
jgi:hypothetical protein